LITDGGPENQNSTVDNCIADEKMSLKKLIAGQDIIFSNSMVEAVNKILKYRYLFHHDIADFKALEKHLAVTVANYNTVRPHYSLKGHTPEQILNGKQLDFVKYKEEMKAAQKKRIEINKLASCGVCQ
jgi:putative transposase